MTTFDITLAGENIKLSPTFKNICQFENGAGSIMGFAFRIGESKASFIDVVNLYAFLQDGTAYSTEVIARKVLADGLQVHLLQIVKVLGEILAGSKENAAAEDEGKK